MKIMLFTKSIGSLIGLEFIVSSLVPIRLRNHQTGIHNSFFASNFFDHIQLLIYALHFAGARFRYHSKSTNVAERYH